MFTWLREELSTIKNRKFHVTGDGGVLHWEHQVDWPVEPSESYRAFIAEFGSVKLYRFLDHWWIRVFDRPIIVEDPRHGTFLMFGGYDSGMACFRLTDLQRGNSQVHETRGVSGLFVTAASFEEWLAGRARKARKTYDKTEWAKIVAGPEPFTEEELEIVAARRLFRWKLLNVAADGWMTFEVTNGSRRRIPFLSIDILGPRLKGGMALPVGDIAPGETRIIEQQGYTHVEDPAKQEAFAKPDPWPEDRERYDEFRTGAEFNAYKVNLFVRVKNAKHLAAEGRFEEALVLYLWCFDEGRKADVSFDQHGMGSLLEAIAKLGSSYSPAIAALETRRNACLQRITAGIGSHQDAWDFAKLNSCLRQSGKTVEIFESLPPGSELWIALATFLRDFLRSNRRYHDLLMAFAPGEFITQREQSLAANQSKGAKIDLLNVLVKDGAPLVEALAGTGNHERALHLARRIFMMLPRKPVKEMLAWHAHRGGDSILAAAIRAMNRVE